MCSAWAEIVHIIRVHGPKQGLVGGRRTGLAGPSTLLGVSGGRDSAQSSTHDGGTLVAESDNRPPVGQHSEGEYAWEYASAVAEAEIRRAAVRAATALGAALGPGTHTSSAGDVYVVADTKSRMRVLRNYVPVVGPLLGNDQPELGECWNLLYELSGSKTAP
jgi:hypothetical protein